MRLFQYLSSLAATACLLSISVDASSQSRNALGYLSSIESPRIHTPSKRVHCKSSFDLTFDLHNHQQHVRLNLEPNHDIIPESAHVNYLDQFGNIRHSEKIDRSKHKVFQGQAYLIDEYNTSTHAGWARISIRRDGVYPLFEGAFALEGTTHNIQLKSSYMQTKHLLDPDLEESDDEYMIVWRNTDVIKQDYVKSKRDTGKTCAADRLTFNNNPNHPVRTMFRRNEGSWGSIPLTSLLGKRQNFDSGSAGNGGNTGGVNLRSTIGNSAGCPNTRQVALVGVATDCTYTAAFNSTQSVQDNIIAQVNTASDVYQATFNITLGLKNLTISDAVCPGTAPASSQWNIACGSTSIEQRLNLFSQWRGQQQDTNAYWSLWTTCNTGPEVGLAWLGQLCSHDATEQGDSGGTTQTVTGANVIARTANLEWQIFAHETGHTFGAVHDCDESACANANTVNSNQCCPLGSASNQCDARNQYLMNPFAADDISRFSPCSVGNICSALGRNSVRSECLSDNRGVETFTGASCGNGIVEGDEQCDCGGAQGCAGNTCCNPQTCRFNEGAVCDPDNEGCCSTQCQFASAGTTCRASTGECDPAETCSGTTGTCPADTTAKDGTKCGSGGLRCASGQCTSRDQQCKTAMNDFSATNNTYACDGGSCLITCGSPDFGARVCYNLNQNFLDGTSCNGDGHCSNGVCRGSSPGGEIRSWIDSNRTLVIALAAGIGGVILLAILGCVIRACRRPRGKRMAAVPGMRRHRRGVHGDQPRSGWDGPAVPQDMRERGYGGQQQNWQPTQQGPSQPPPVYPGYQGYNSGQGGNTSVRYA